MAAAPPDSYARTRRTRSRSGLITPFDGDERFTSAITPISARLRAVAKLGCTGAASAFRRSSASDDRSVAARAAASSVNAPRTPPGGSQGEKACASVDLRLTYEFGKCSVGSADRSTLNQPRKKGYVAHKTPAGDSDLPRHLLRRARLRAKFRGDRDAV